MTARRPSLNRDTARKTSVRICASYIAFEQATAPYHIMLVLCKAGLPRRRYGRRTIRYSLQIILHPDLKNSLGHLERLRHEHARVLP
jgi:hypothetical protein